MKKLMAGSLILIVLIFHMVFSQASSVEKKPADLKNELPANSSSKADTQDKTDSVEAGIMLAKLINKYHFISDTKQYNQDKCTRLLKSMLETWDPDKIFFVRADKDYFSHLLDLLEEQTIPTEIDFRIAEMQMNRISAYYG